LETSPIEVSREELRKIQEAEIDKAISVRTQELEEMILANFDDDKPPEKYHIQGLLTEEQVS